jgi:hypothetical protein
LTREFAVAYRACKALYSGSIPLAASERNRTSGGISGRSAAAGGGGLRTNIAQAADASERLTLDSRHLGGEEIGHLTIPVLGGVLVDQRRPRGRVPDAGHQLLEGDSRAAANQRGGMVAQIVNMETFPTTT